MTWKDQREPQVTTTGENSTFMAVTVSDGRKVYLCRILILPRNSVTPIMFQAWLEVYFGECPSRRLDCILRPGTNGANEAERLGRLRTEALPVPHMPVPGDKHCVWK